MKDPAFPFYAQDFLTGVMHLTMAERGIYITLLSYQWAHGKIPKDRLGLILGSGWETLWHAVAIKFIESETGFLTNVRLEEERSRRADYKRKQTENGKKGGRPKGKTTGNEQDNTTNNHQTEIKEEKPIKTQNLTQKKPLENESEYENENINEHENGKEGMGEKPVAAMAIGHVVPPFAGAEFATQWTAWKRYRQTEHHRSYRSPESEQAALLELATLSNACQTTAIAILHQSMGKGWKGLFALTPEHGNKPPAGQSRVQYSDAFKRKIAERLRTGKLP